MKINFAQAIIDQSLAYPDKLAIRDGTDDLTYGQLITRIQQVANGLFSYGLKSRDRVIIHMEDCVDWPVVFLACLYKNIVPLPLATSMGPDLFWKIADFVECSTVISGNDQIPKLGLRLPVISRTDIQEYYISQPTVSEPVFVDPDAESWMNISSGSTGMPKVAVHRHQSMFEMRELMPLTFSMTVNDTIMSVAKMSWNFGLHNTISSALGIGATAIVIPDPPAAPTIFDFANKFRPDILITSPSIVRRLLQPQMSKYTLPDSIRHFHSSGEHTPKTMYDKFKEQFGLPLHSCIGMMETSANYCANFDTDHDPGTVGKPLPKCKIKLINEQGQECQGNEVGEIYASSPAAAFYYLKNYSKTKQTFVGEWVRTGDMGYWNENGNLVFVGRTDDVFKINDLIISPVEIESQIGLYTGVEQVAITGIETDRGNKELHAFVVPTNNFNLDDFRKFLKQHLFTHQVPKQIHIVDSLPETITNKKDRKTLRNVIKL